MCLRVDERLSCREEKAENSKQTHMCEHGVSLSQAPSFHLTPVYHPAV